MDNEKWEQECMERASYYAFKFGERPPILYMIPYTDKHYADLILQAIVRGSPITSEELDKMAEAEPYDLED